MKASGQAHIAAGLLLLLPLCLFAPPFPSTAIPLLMAPTVHAQSPKKDHLLNRLQVHQPVAL